MARFRESDRISTIGEIVRIDDEDGSIKLADYDAARLTTTEQYLTLVDKRPPAGIHCHRRRFLGTAAMIIAGMEFAIGATARAQLAGQDDTIAAKNADMAALKAQIAAKDTEIAALKARIAELQGGEPRPPPPTGELQGPVGSTQIPSLTWQEQPSDWLNVKTAFGAVGNGVADDSTPIQNALDALDNNSGIKAVVYLPAGTYRITRTLKQTFREGSSLIGHGRDTIISWDGPVGGTMFVSDSNAFSNFEGITWRGNGRAATGVDHNSKQRRESRMLHRHEAFLDFTDIALKVSPNKPDQKYTEEVLYDNCLFRNGRVGISLQQDNDYLHSITSCSFYNMDIGVHCNFGQAFIRNSHFEGSRNTDILFAGSTHGQSVRRVTSKNSRMFVQMGLGTGWSNNLPVTIQDCQVEGWTNVDGAVIGHFRGPTTIFDTSFKRPPAGAKQTILLANQANFDQIIVHSQVTTEATPLINPGLLGKVHSIPSGERRAYLKDANQVFLKGTGRGFGKVFDVRNFGASLTSADNGPAFQAAVNAAKAAGNGAVAYIPGGNWNMWTTVVVDGGNYVVSGAGFKTKTFWNAGNQGPMFLVRDPQNIVIQRMNLGFDQYNALYWAIQQVSTGIGSKVIYDDVCVRTDAGATRQQGLLLDGLRKNDTAILYSVLGQAWVRSSSSATVLMNTMGYTSIVAEGEGPQDGFMGLLTGLAAGRNLNVHIKDNLSFVASDLYTEQSTSHILAEGTDGQPAGRITISSPRLNTPGSLVDMTINNYQGRISLTSSPYDSLAVPPPIYKVVHTGMRPLSVVYVGNVFMGESMASAPIFDMSPSANCTLIGNIIDSWAAPNPAVKWSVPNVVPTNGLQEAAAALDHFRELGEMDLILNEGFSRA